MFENLEFGNNKVFMLIKEAMNDIKKIEEIYSSLIDKLLVSEYWSEDKTKAPRVKWYHGETARQIRRDVFNQSGIYLWGAGSVPRYIGKAEKQSFNRRFSRYIFSENSQCNLAKKYEKEIISKGIDGFPPEIREWYRRRFHGTVRLRHAVDFARHGINDIWFTLFPTDDIDAIGTIEEIFINVANNWNIEKGLDPLVNEQHI